MTLAEAVVVAAAAAVTAGVAVAIGPILPVVVEATGTVEVVVATQAAATVVMSKTAVEVPETNHAAAAAETQPSQSVPETGVGMWKKKTQLKILIIFITKLRLQIILDTFTLSAGVAIATSIEGEATDRRLFECSGLPLSTGGGFGT
jgi:hypothetical protein